ncbi:MAG: MFS transporter [Bilophila sp.]
MNIPLTPPHYRKSFILITSLFLIVGISYGLMLVLNKQFQEVLNVSKFQSGLIQSAYFSAYFVIALPVGIFLNRYGYKAGVLVSLSIFAVGTLLFFPAAQMGTFTPFLLALFVMALGLGGIETASNAYSASLGDKSRSETRLNLSQSFNGLGQFLGPIIGGILFFGGNEGAQGEVAAGSNSGLDVLSYTYLGITVLVLLLILLFTKAPLPDLRGIEEAEEAEGGKQSMWAHKEFIAGVATQFFYVAAQVGVGAFFINLCVETWPGCTSQQGSFLLSVAMFLLLTGRFLGTAIMTRVAPARLLSLFGMACVLLSLLAITGIPYVAVLGVIGIFFFISIMFPTIFAMGTKHLGTDKRLGSSCMIMAIAGGAIIPYVMGGLADSYGTAASYALPMACFVIVTLYGLCYKRFGVK